MSKPTIRKRRGVWVLHDGMIDRPVSSHQEGMRVLASRQSTMCLHAECHRQRGTNPYGVCDVHAPAPVPNRLLKARIDLLERSFHLERTAA